MCGKSLTSWLIALSLALLPSALGAVSPAPAKDKLTVNGYDLVGFGKNEIEGVRAKAVADQFFRKGAFSQAIKYYEKASRLIANEADVYFNLANIYAYERVYRMAASYYKIAAEKYQLPENFGKTQKNYYLSLIRYSFSLQKTREYDNNEELSRKTAAVLIENEETIRKKYPELVTEMENLFKIIYGSVRIRNNP